jgi:nucleoside-diphosphate-sugar epimerase
VIDHNRKTALVVGVTGIVGRAVADRLVEQGWRVFGLARTAQVQKGVEPVTMNLLNEPGLREALAHLDLTHVFFCSWSRQATEAMNIEVNGAMLKNLLTALSASKTLEHFALVTGTRQYLGPFEAGVQVSAETPFREETPRLEMDHFYYVWEDMLFAAAEKQHFTWSVHRPQPVIGFAVGNAMNTATTLAVYATICRETGRPFVFPGSKFHWDAITDVSDARQIARQVEWAAVTPAARNQAFNTVNGDVFRWRWLWPQIAAYFGLVPEPPVEPASPLELTMKNTDKIWADIATKYDLKERDVNRLATWWFADWDLGRQLVAITDMNKSRRLGFNIYQESSDSFFHVFDEMREERLIP